MAPSGAPAGGLARPDDAQHRLTLGVVPDTVYPFLHHGLPLLVLTRLQRARTPAF